MEVHTIHSRQETGIVAVQARAFLFDSLEDGVPPIAAGILESQNRIMTQEY
jgi:hypothetical protein